MILSLTAGLAACGGSCLLYTSIQRIIESQNLTVEQAEELMLKTDKSRAAYYNYCLLYTSDPPTETEDKKRIQYTVDHHRRQRRIHR